VKHWEMGLREPSSEICEKLGGLATTLDLADYWAECAGLPPYSGESLHHLTSPLGRDAAAVPSTDAQTRMELHAGLDIILDRAPEAFREKLARDITQGAGRFEHSPVIHSSGSPPTAREKRLMRLLGKVLGSGNSEAAEAASKNLEVLARYVEAVESTQTSSSASRSHPSGPASGTNPARRVKPRPPSRSD